MRPVPNSILSLLLLALSVLCAWQWDRESKLRTLAETQRAQLTAITTQHDELESRVKAADAEILRITASLAELRTNSVSKETHAEALAASQTMREAGTKQNAAIQQANDTIQKLTTERDDLAKRLNDITAKYNALIKKQ